MTPHEQQTLARFTEQILKIRVHRDRSGAPSLKKPLLLLLVLARIERGSLTENRISFTSIANELRELIRQFGQRNTRSGVSADQPFVYMKTAPFWELHLPPNAPETTRDQCKRSVLGHPDTYAALENDVFTLLSASPEARRQLAETILGQWWKEPVRTELGLHLGFQLDQAQ